MWKILYVALDLYFVNPALTYHGEFYSFCWFVFVSSGACCITLYRFHIGSWEDGTATVRRRRKISMRI